MTAPVPHTDDDLQRYMRFRDEIRACEDRDEQSGYYTAYGIGAPSRDVARAFFFGEEQLHRGKHRQKRGIYPHAYGKRPFRRDRSERQSRCDRSRTAGRSRRRRGIDRRAAEA